MAELQYLTLDYIPQQAFLKFDIKSTKANGWLVKY